MKERPKSHREKKSAILARRSFLKAVGAAATILPFYKMLEDNVALADAGELPLRFVGVGAWHGTTQKFYARQAGETDTDFDISYADSCFRPFDQPAEYGYSFRDKLLVFEGFDYGVARIGGNTYADGTVGEINTLMHGCLGLFLTGSATRDGEINSLSHELSNASLDQYLAGLYGGTTPFRSVEMTTEASSSPTTRASIAAGEGGALLSTMTSPERIWDRFFASLVMTDPMAAAAAEHRRAVDQSALDFVAADLQRLNARLAGPEKQKLDQHLTVIRDLERQLTATMPGCGVPPRHAEDDPVDGYRVGTTDNDAIVDLDRVANMQIELLAQILICDLTRFATLVLPGFAGPITGPPYVPNLDGTDMVTGSVYTDIPIPADFHIEIAHKMDTGHLDDVSLEHHRAAAGVQRYYHGKVARLMQRLEDAGILDSTVILVGNEGGMGASHQTRLVPIVMAGGANGAFRMGRRIVAPGRVARAQDYPTHMDGSGVLDERTMPTSHNPILVEVANVFRAAAGDPPIDRFGTCALHPEFTTGISGLI